jgi:small subunit ribosomal protein S9
LIDDERPEQEDDGPGQEAGEATPEESPGSPDVEAEGSGDPQPASEQVAGAPEQEGGAEETPAPAAEAEAPAETEATEQPAEAAAPAEDAPAAQPATDGGEAEAPEAAEQAPEAKPRDKAARPEKGKDVVPGADLDPIAITDERELTAEERARLEAEEEERRRREAAAEEGDDEALPRRGAAAVPTDVSIQATGKRKSSVARVVVRAGTGKVEVNGRSLDDYFPRPNDQSIARQPLLTAGYDSSVDVRIRVHGGGVSGQAGAVRHGIARALVELDPELRGDLKRRGLLTRDAREKERRKAGLKKARKRPQFSKR